MIVVIFLSLIVVFSLWFSIRYAWWRKPESYSSPRIFMYHMIKNPVAGARFNGLRVSPLMFERQLRWFKNNGWNSYTISELIERNDKIPEKIVVLTFDDGFEDNYENAFPLLKKYGFKATLYLVVDRHERDWSVSKKKHHNSGELMKEPKLNDEQVDEMLASGLVELGGHSLTHINFSKESESEKYRQILQSKILLEDKFNTTVNSFAYPFGIYDARDPLLVKKAGYSSAVTTESGIESQDAADKFQLKRIKISGKDSFQTFVLRVQTGQRGFFK